MSLARFALRTATVKALRGRTFAGQMVRDSEIGPIDETAAEQSIPFVCVYTDDTQSERTGTDLLANDGRTTLVIETGVTTRMTPAGDWEIPTTDAGMELTIDAVERQIRLALSTPDPANAWAELWRDLVQGLKTEKSQRGGAAKDGVRFAGRQLMIDVDLPRDPHPGRPIVPGTIWGRFLALCAADADLAGLVPMLTALVTGGATDWQQWQRDRAAYGLSAARARALQIMPPLAAEPSSPVFTGVTTAPPDLVPPTFTPVPE